MSVRGSQKEVGLILLLPEVTNLSSAATCFNWHAPDLNFDASVVVRTDITAPT